MQQDTAIQLTGAGRFYLAGRLSPHIIRFTLIFGRSARLPSDGVPYQLFALAALVPWTCFNTAVSGASNSLFARDDPNCRRSGVLALRAQHPDRD